MNNEETGFTNLDRFLFIDERREVFPFLLKGKELHESVLDFGLYAVTYCNDNHKNLLSDAPIMMLLREILEVHDTISILSENMATRPAQANLRAQLELYLQLKFIFMNDVHERAKAYHVDSVLKKIELYRYMATINELTQSDADARIDNLETMLRINEYVQIRDLIRNMRAQRNQQFAPWYMAYEARAKNLKKLAEVVNLDETYELYGPLSKYAHGFLAMEGVQTDSSGSPVIRLFRLPLNYVELLNISGRLSADSIKHVYSYYCVDWQPHFNEWYNNWSSEVEQFSSSFPRIRYR